MNLVDTFVSYGFKPETCSQRTHFPFVVVEVVDANVVDVSVVVEVEVVEEVDSVVLGGRVVAVCHDLCQLIFLEYPPVWVFWSQLGGMWMAHWMQQGMFW